MKVVIASGKGGTGKTTLSLALFQSITGQVSLLDCDVEEPNCHLFLDPLKNEQELVSVAVPVVDEEKCNGCGACSSLCQFNAIISIGGTKALVFSDLCHSCGGCLKVCPEKAISEEPFKIGTLDINTLSENKKLYTGTLKIGHAMAPPLIKAVLKRAKAEHQIIDAPPGSSCSFSTAAKGADYVIFVTEPTPFGLSDLTLVVDSLKKIGTPFGVIVNRNTRDHNPIELFCKDNSIPLLMSIDEDPEVAKGYSEGKTLVDVKPEYKVQFQKLFKDLLKQSQEGTL